MEKNSVAKNYIYNVTYEILAIIIPLITTPYLSRVLGAERIGIYGYTISIVTYFILFGSLGIAMYGKREIAYVQKDEVSRTKILFEIVLLRLITLIVSMIMFYICFCRTGEYRIYYIILLLEIISNIIDISWFFQGLEEFKKTVTRNIIVKFISTVCIFIFVKTADDLYKYFIIYVLSNFIGNISLWFYLPKYLTKIKIKTINITHHLKHTIMLFIPQIATQIYTVLDKTMIGTIIPDKSEVGYYEQAQKVVKLLLTIATSLGTVMMPRIAATYADGNTNKIKRYMSLSLSYIMMIAFPLMFGIISVANHFVPFFYGNGYEKVYPIMCIISPIIIFIGLSNVTGIQYLLPTKQQNKYTISVLAGAIINFILNLILIKSYGAIGASIATVVAELGVTAVQLYMVRKQITIKEILSLSYKYFFASIIMFFVSFVLGLIIKNNTLSILIQVFISVLVYFALLYIIKDKLFMDGMNKIKRRIEK